MFALVDCNNFYASCERVFRPDLVGKPVVVLSNNDGCVIARSEEAKIVGIPMGAPAFQFEQIFKENGVNVFSANFALYGDMSHRVMAILQEYTPEYEIYSIDEAFLKLKGFDLYNLKNYGIEMSQRVRKWTGIPVSIGIAPTKALAKIANRIAKKFPTQTGTCHVIDSEEKRLKALKWTKIEDVWGIGRKNAIRLREIGVKTAFDFTKIEDNWVKRNLSIVGVRLKRDLQGIPTLDLEEIVAKKKISTTRSFEHTLSRLEDLKERITTFAVSCAEKLRKQDSCCKALYVFVRNNPFKESEEFHKMGTVVKLPFPTNSSIEIARFANQALEHIFVPGIRYKKAGVIILDFIPQSEIQLSLFENSHPKHHQLMKAMDRINLSFGQQKLRLASQDQNRVWKMKQERLSPRYTTCLSEVIVVNV